MEGGWGTYGVFVDAVCDGLVSVFNFLFDDDAVDHHAEPLFVFP